MRTSTPGDGRRTWEIARRWLLPAAVAVVPVATLAAIEAPWNLSRAGSEVEPSDAEASSRRPVPDATAPAVPAAPDTDAPFDPRDNDVELRARLQRSLKVGGPRVGPPIGGSLWVSQGAGPALFGQAENVVPNDEVSGAVHCLAPHPTNADILYLGAVNGGVWKTTNATAASPTWVPLTDLQLGLSIGALEFDPTDATRQTLVAGVGRFSSFGSAGPFRKGLLRTTNGGSTWTALDGGGVLLDKNISGVAARGSTLVVSVNNAVPFTFANIGVFRSVDGGATFTQISGGDGSATGLPGGSSFDLEGDPTSATTLYTNTNFSDNVGGVNGIYKSTNTGATWAKVSNAAMDAVLVSGQTSNVEISVGSAGQVYVAILNFGQLINGGVFRSGDGGTTWQTMDIPLTNEGGIDVDTNPTFHPDHGQPGSQGAIHFSIQADPADPDIVYVGGDRQPAPLPNSIGAQDFSGRLFRGDASLPGGSQWVHLTHSDSLGAPGGGTASSSAPHADSREIAFDANGDIIECDDGGIYRRTFPQTNVGDWFSIIGNLAVNEFHDVAYDRNADVLIGGTQDNGTLLQLAPGGTTWENIRGGDGGDVAVDDTSVAGFSIRYFSSQNLGGFSRFTYDSGNNFISAAFPALTLVGGGTPLDGQFSTPIALSEINQIQLVIGGDGAVYESLDQGETIREIGAGITVNSTTSGNAMAYGGSLPGSPNPHVLYVGAGATVFRRTTAGSLLAATSAVPSGGQTVRDIVMDPENWNRVYVITDSMVFLSNDGGTTWSNITGDLTGVETLRSGVFVTGTFEEALLVGSNLGVYRSLRTSLGTWNEIGTNLPNAAVWDLDYDAADDVLVAGTLGRGAWVIPSASTTILPDCFGPGVTCLGACCLAASCTDSTTEAACTAAAGIWHVGDTCDTACLGSCCVGFACADDHTAGTCASAGGAFKLGGQCATSSCSGACCEALSCADNVTQTSCGSTWFEGGSCAADCFGACCTGSTCTDLITAAACGGLGGLFFIGENCGSIFCACVNGVGDCASSHSGPGCDSADCCSAVCAQNASCCTTDWTSSCAGLALASCAENDNCPDAFPIPEGIRPFDNSLATTDGPPDCLNGDTNVGTKDIWYVHNSACTGSMTVDLCTATNFDNTLQIYETSSCGPFGPQLACGDDTCGQGGGPATLTVPVIQGTAYLIRVGGWAGASGPGQIDLSIAPADPGDTDGDGIANSCDICPGGDDNVDTDGDGIPDFCDICPNGNNQADADGDGVPDACDACPGGDDNVDTDGDSVPDFCDICPGGNDLADADGDGVPDFCDLCPGGDDNVDTNNNGIPDACEALPPAIAPAPHDGLKNRYISFAPNNGASLVAFRVTRASPPFGDVGWVGVPDAAGIARVVPAPVFRIWPEAVVHVGDCPIIPVAAFELRTTANGSVFSSPLPVSTIALPAGGKFWGDTVGQFGIVTPGVWDPPNGVVNVNDFVAALEKFQNSATPRVHLTVVDVVGAGLPGQEACLNRSANIADVFNLIKAFQGTAYPFTTDPGSCPVCP
ncbi:MAG: thrombospondin type 3 repeat-containing protein [Planctomycetes bacterium]|nr:thrombospondin type 3 repeat-containing protein [Planctomycetota bacterium]